MINVLDPNSDRMINARRSVSMLHAWTLLETVYFFPPSSLDKLPSCHFDACGYKEEAASAKVFLIILFADVFYK